MKKISGLTTALLLLLSFTLWTATGDAMDSPGFTVKRLAVCAGIEELEPVGISDVFPATTEKVYCFLEASNIGQDTEVTFIWYSRDTEIARATLALRKGWRWRTYSSKKLTGLAKGQWRVELQDASGTILTGIDFRLE